MSLTIDARQKGVTQTIDLAIDAEVQSVSVDVHTETEWLVVCDLAEKKGHEVSKPDKWSHRPSVTMTIAGVFMQFKGPKQPDEHFDDEGSYIGPQVPSVEPDGEHATPFDAPPVT